MGGWGLKTGVKKKLANDKSIKIVSLFRLIHMECSRRKAQDRIKVPYKLGIENFFFFGAAGAVVLSFKQTRNNVFQNLRD